jgi:sigma-B regulation protein RsbU (phosphoserine phosphatase)
MEPRSRSGSGGYTLGVLADLLEGEYQSAVVGGMVEGAREAGANILLLADSLRRAVVRGGARSDITYDLAGSDRVDGVIVMAGPLGNIVGLDELGRYCERFEPRPMCSVAAPVPGMAAILVDGAPALSQGVTHLVQDHGLRKIAFLGGPALNVEAQQRLATFRRTMADLGVEVPDEFVLSGEFRYEFGIEGVRVFLDERQIQEPSTRCASGACSRRGTLPCWASTTSAMPGTRSPR